MEKEKLETLLIDYIDGKLASGEVAQIERLIASDEQVRRLYEEFREVMRAMKSSAAIEPSPALRQGFDRILQEEVRLAEKRKTVFFSPLFYRVAAAIAFVVIGGGQASGSVNSKSTTPRWHRCAWKLNGQRTLCSRCWIIRILPASV